MNNTSIPVIIIAAISFYVGLYHFLMYFRRTTEKENLSFSLLSFTVGMYNVFCAFLYNSTSIAEGMNWQRYQWAVIALLAITMLWFVYHLTSGHRMKKSIMIAASMLFMVFLVLGFAVRNELTLSLKYPLPKHIELWGFINVIYHEVDLGLIYTVQSVFTFIAFFYVFYVLISYYRKTRNSFFLAIIISQIWFFLSWTSDILVASGVYHFIYLAEYGWMAITMAMAYFLLNKFVDLHNEVEDLNRGLERKVADRTQELSAANQELEAINDHLTEARDALWGEMQLAKKIQTVLLPKKLSIPGYELSALMKPADEVGGDYYDVISVKNCNWIVIGDVSGHGVPAGLVMMMVQTSISTVLDNIQGIHPSQVLESINTTIRKNIDLMGEDKYMTITVLSATEEGKFKFSGLHQDIIIYRAETGKVEFIKTQGIWIGIMDDIDNMLDDYNLVMNKGDVMLLYTDGITEGWVNGSVRDKRDAENDMYGEERLAESLKRNGTRPVNEIKERILEDFDKGYYTNDDITLMVIKRV